MRGVCVSDVCEKTDNDQVALAMLDAACAKEPENQALLMARQHLKEVMGDSPIRKQELSADAVAAFLEGMLKASKDNNT